MKLASSAFNHNELIPFQYTCDGENFSPPLAWEHPPSGVQSFALIVEDPDARSGTWVHWIVWNMPSSATSLKEKIPRQDQLSDGTQQGKTDFGDVGYGGPCPPSGIHRYFFKLYALDVKLNLAKSATKAQLLSAMQGHILGQTEMIGLYGRSSK